MIPLTEHAKVMSCAVAMPCAAIGQLKGSGTWMTALALMLTKWQVFRHLCASVSSATESGNNSTYLMRLLAENKNNAWESVKRDKFPVSMSCWYYIIIIIVIIMFNSQDSEK